MISLEGVGKSYGENIALAPVSLSFAARSTSVLIGPSGCGKSTLLRLIVGLVRPDSGEVRIGNETLRADNVERLRHGIGYVIQDGGLFPHLTAGRNVALLASYLKRSPAWIAERCGHLADLMQIPAGLLKRFPRELSGGQRQRVSLMRALMLDPPVLLLDEPLGALDPVTRYELQEELKRVFEELAKTVVLVTHDMSEAAFLGAHIVLLRAGRVVQAGSFAEFLSRPAERYVTDFIRAQRAAIVPGAVKDMRSLLALLVLVPALSWAQPTVNVGSKRFTESYILGEIIATTVQATGEARATHRQGLGNTAIVFAALRGGVIDLYADYTGTIAFELLKKTRPATLEELNRELAPLGLGAGVRLGFNNTYALAMRDDRAAELSIAAISDLKRLPELRFGLSQEFLNRRDGWPALARAYGLNAAPRGLDHGLAYEAAASGRVDVIDVYSTDAKLDKFRLRVLADDRGFFPKYEAVLLYRLDFPKRFPRTWEALNRLEGRITAKDMVALNAQAEIAGVPFAEVARGFLAGGIAGEGARPRESRRFLELLIGEDFWRLTAQHLLLVFTSLALSITVGVPLGIWAGRSPPAAGWILGSVGMLQTIPSLALLAFLITLTGTIGTAPAIAALFLYALLPIARSTASGLADIALPLRESAQALGLPSGARLRLIELPLAARSILAGVKTSTVINVGTATIAAFVGAGGYGERIVAGLAVNDNTVLLAGAVPAALMALAMQLGFDILDRWLIPAGLRYEEGARA